MSKRPVPVLEALGRSRFLLLLICLLLQFAIEPILVEKGFAVFGRDLAFGAVLIAGVWSASHHPRLLTLGLLLATPVLFATWVMGPAPGPTRRTLALAFALAFIVFTAANMLVLVLRSKAITTDTILGGICVYMLLGITWALTFSILEILEPQSFGTPAGPLNVASAERVVVVPELLHYSVFVLTSMGPGYVQPLTPVARAWTGIAAITGQLYLAVFIARLVGMHASQLHRDG